MSLGLDYTFLLAYPTAIAAAIVFLASRSERPSRVAMAIAWAQWVAAALDAIENFALWQRLTEGARAPWPAIAAWCAAPKFVIVGAGLVTMLVLGARALRRA